MSPLSYLAAPPRTSTYRSRPVGRRTFSATRDRLRVNASCLSPDSNRELPSFEDGSSANWDREASGQHPAPAVATVPNRQPVEPRRAGGAARCCPRGSPNTPNGPYQDTSTLTPCPKATAAPDGHVGATCARFVRTPLDGGLTSTKRCCQWPIPYLCSPGGIRTRVQWCSGTGSYPVWR